VQIEQHKVNGGAQKLARIYVREETKTVTRTVAVPKTKIVKQQPQQQTAPKDKEPTDFTPIRPQPPLPNQQDNRENAKNTPKVHDL